MPHALAPCERVELEAALGAGLRQSGCGLAIDVRLPFQRAERLEVVFPALELDPRQPVAAMHAAGGSRAERAVPILDADLRHDVKHQPAHRARAHRDRQDERHETRPYPAGKSTLLDHKGERAIRSSDEAPRKANALGLVS